MSNIKPTYYVLTFVIFFVVSFSGFLLIPKFDVNINLVEPKSYTPSYNNKNGEEIVLVFIGSPNCSWSTKDSLKTALRASISDLHSYTIKNNYSYDVIGVSANWDVSSGTDYLTNITKFDEIIVGNNWLNSAGIKYFWGELAGKPSLPQVIVYKRSIRDFESRNMRIENEELLARKIGHEIYDWSSDGSPLPKY